MKRDCPHCHESMDAAVQWRQFAKMDATRACPMCNRDIELATYPEEIGVRVLALVVILAAGFWAKQRGGDYVAIFAGVVVFLGLAFFFVSRRLRDRQRFRAKTFK